MTEIEKLACIAWHKSDLLSLIKTNWIIFITPPSYALYFFILGLKSGFTPQDINLFLAFAPILLLALYCKKINSRNVILDLNDLVLNMKTTMGKQYCGLKFWHLLLPYIVIPFVAVYISRQISLYE
jgi:glucan phosphoethanolaminetransferase (alkaline phosphatase superfamily)